MAHAAVAAPLDRALGRQLPALGLAAGALAPDLEFFLNGRIERSISHEPYGVVLLDLPLALAFLVVTGSLVVPGVVGLLGPGSRHLATPIGRAFVVDPGTWTSIGAIARLVVAILIGASSHLIWDEFTHGPIIDAPGLGWLNSFPFSIGEADFALYSVVQWVSTAVGLGALMIGLDRWLGRQAIDGQMPASVRFLTGEARVVGLAAVAATTAAFAVQHPAVILDDEVTRPEALGDLLATATVWGMTGCYVALAAIGAALRLGLVGRRPILTER